ncbi:hypothetical protein E1262_22290 [Jiangella aurantiaca]|uniref:Uncharacterized protein n=1 Tax=Jiangella aurantiaca TaxID=2530373 RepID=A0A4R5A336_9ACTN|nr:hypothetical protein [Jiangella aurantiaca]TDD66338.1 hypothetical protein E1262_22290 [Jiangella aurantiaca]
MTDTRDAPPLDGHTWPAWALPAAAIAGPGASGAGVGMVVARYWSDPGPLALIVVMIVVATLCGAGVVSRAMRHERRRYAVTEIAVMLAIALLFYADGPLGRAVLAALVGGGLLATARRIRGDRRRQATKMQNGWPDGSA